ncbi:hypothetical protein R6Y99_15165 [Pseudomonas lundensis]|uniref:hypothetical protein n=1 Tax=Serratia proteamaculans TaxID=28151 RepID=UPI0029822C80|nr:hypothetical protein [Serratia proteamaculans]MDW5501130.1 hypothetical protein [Serratia proteamaculans]MDW5506195.1 hypothetical protein [Pseudomonas lundensis]
MYLALAIKVFVIPVPNAGNALCDLGFINNLIVAKFTPTDKAKIYLRVEKTTKND